MKEYNTAALYEKRSNIAENIHDQQEHTQTTRAEITHV
jgi:hypothetical protein